MAIINSSKPTNMSVPAVSSKPAVTSSVGKNISSVPTSTIQKVVGTTVDNKYGANTTSAVKAFQTANGLTADGIVGPKTSAAILAAQSKTSTSTGSSRSGSSSSIIDSTGTAIQTNGSLGVPSATTTPVVSSNSLKTKVVPSAQSVISTQDTNLANAESERMRISNLNANTPETSQYYSNGDKNPNYKAPVTSPETPKTAEQMLAEEGTQKVYNQNTGQEQTINTGEAIPTGYGEQNPLTRKDVSGSIDAGGGVTIKKFSDGTYGRFNLGTGDYAQVSSEDFNNAQRVADAQKVSDDAKNGVYLPSQQKQIDATMKLYQDTIDKQIGENTLMAYGINAAQRGAVYLGSASIADSFKSGLERIVSLSAQRDTAIANMKAGFEADDVNAVKDSFAIYTQNSQDIQKQIDQNQTMMQNEKIKQDTKNQAYALTAAAKYRDTTEPISQFDTQQEVDRKVQTSAVYQNELKTKSGIVDPTAIKGMAEVWTKGGPYPSFSGISGAAQRAAFYAYLGGKPELIGKAISNKITLAAANSALNKQKVLATGTESAVTAMEGNMDVAQKLIDKVSKTGSPIINDYLLWSEGKLGVASEQRKADIAALDTSLNAVSTHYAKIMAGAASSIAGVPVTSMEEAKSLINSSLTKMQLGQVFDILRADGNIQKTAYDSTLKNITDDISELTKSDYVDTGIPETTPTTSTTNTSSTGGTDAISTYAHGGAF